MLKIQYKHLKNDAATKTKNNSRKYPHRRHHNKKIKYLCFSVWPASFFPLPPPWLRVGRRRRLQTLPKRTKRKRKKRRTSLFTPLPFSKGGPGRVVCNADVLPGPSPPSKTSLLRTRTKPLSHMGNTKRKQNPPVVLRNGEIRRCSSWEEKVAQMPILFRVGCFVWRE